MAGINFKLTEDVHEKLRRQAKRQKRSLTQQIIFILERAIEDEKLTANAREAAAKVGE